MRRDQGIFRINSLVTLRQVFLGGKVRLACVASGNATLPTFQMEIESKEDQNC